MSRDPIGHQATDEIWWLELVGTNPYNYVLGNPIGWVDYSGLLRCDASESLFPCNASGGAPKILTNEDPVRIYGEVRFHAKFKNSGDCRCRCCAMELWVRGDVRIIGPPPGNRVVPIPPHILPGSNQPIDEHEYRQDSPRIKPTGCEINKTDHPGIRLPKSLWDRLLQIPGVRIELHYDYELYTIDTCQKNVRISTYDYNWWLTGPIGALKDRNRSRGLRINGGFAMTSECAVRYALVWLLSCAAVLCLAIILALRGLSTCPVATQSIQKLPAPMRVARMQPP